MHGRHSACNFCSASGQDGANWQCCNLQRRCWRYSPILVIANVQSSDVGAYRVVVANSAGSVTSTPAMLTLITSQLTGSVVSLGGPAVPPGLDDVVAIAAGYGQQLAVRSNGTVVC